ncbi:MAG: hypothetical protein ACM3QZ_00800 [Solirubrobacterales bacterium]
MKMIIIGGLCGFIASFGFVWLNLKSIRQGVEMPGREALRYIILRFFIRVTALIAAVGLLTYWLGIPFGMALLAGMGLGYLGFLILGMKKGPVVARLTRSKSDELNGPLNENPLGKGGKE